MWLRGSVPCFWVSDSKPLKWQSQASKHPFCRILKENGRQWGDKFWRSFKLCCYDYKVRNCMLGGAVPTDGDDLVSQDNQISFFVAAKSTRIRCFRQKTPCGQNKRQDDWEGGQIFIKQTLSIVPCSLMSGLDSLIKVIIITWAHSMSFRALHTGLSGHPSAHPYNTLWGGGEGRDRAQWDTIYIKTPMPLRAEPSY